MNRRCMLTGFIIGTPWISAAASESETEFTIEARLRAMLAKLQAKTLEAQGATEAAMARATRLEKELTAARQEIEQWKSIVEDYSQANKVLSDELFAWQSANKADARASGGIFDGREE